MLRERAELFAELRKFFAQRAVLEVQTPVIGRFSVTDPSIRAIELEDGYLQTSTEYHQKRLLAAGIGDNYTLGPVFRAGESGQTHNPEFTMLEWYRCGFDEHMLMSEIAQLVDEVLGPADYDRCNASEMFEAAEVEYGTLRKTGQAPELEPDLVSAWCMDRAYRSLPSGRCFVVDFPADQALLAQLDAANPCIGRRFELLIDGIELANGYFELTDPVELQARFAADNRRRGQSWQAIDTRLIAALEQGMPACAGVALGVDRLLMLKLGLEHIDQVQAFSWARR